MLKDSIIASGHLGVALYDLNSKQFLYRYQSDKLFVPASTNKLLTLYAGMKFLGDSLNGLYYKINHDTLFVIPTGDPTFMHPDFKEQPVHQMLNSTPLKVVLLDEQQYPEPYGKGWTIDDLDEAFLPQRSIFPVNGNLFSAEWIKNANNPTAPTFSLASISSDLPDYRMLDVTTTSTGINSIHRIPGHNHFTATLSDKNNTIRLKIPFETFGMETGFHILKNMLYHSPQKKISPVQNKSLFSIIHSQPTDSVLALMMHRSDNFYAEQLLLMCGSSIAGELNQQNAIDYLLHNDFKKMPQQPQWFDGSGLSRYNLISPEDEIFVMNQLIDSFGTNRLTRILPTGGRGTLKKMFLTESNEMFAKTGSMSNIYSLTGMLLTANGKKLLFSIMLNNYSGSASSVKKAIENFLRSVKES